MRPLASICVHVRRCVCLARLAPRRGPVGTATSSAVQAAAKLTVKGAVEVAKIAAPIGKWALQVRERGLFDRGAQPRTEHARMQQRVRHKVCAPLAPSPLPSHGFHGGTDAPVRPADCGGGVLAPVEEKGELVVRIATAPVAARCSCRCLQEGAKAAAGLITRAILESVKTPQGSRGSNGKEGGGKEGGNGAKAQGGLTGTMLLKRRSRTPPPPQPSRQQQQQQQQQRKGR